MTNCSTKMSVTHPTHIDVLYGADLVPHRTGSGQGPACRYQLGSDRSHWTEGCRRRDPHADAMLGPLVKGSAYAVAINCTSGASGMASWPSVCNGCRFAPFEHETHARGGRPLLQGRPFRRGLLRRPGIMVLARSSYQVEHQQRVRLRVGPSAQKCQDHGVDRGPRGEGKAQSLWDAVS